LAVAAALSACGETAAPRAEVSGSAAKVVAEASPAAAELEIRSLLVRANLAFRNGRFVQPAGDNALDWSVQVLQADADNAAARSIIIDLIPLAEAVIDANLSHRNIGEAERVVALLATASPDSMTVASLKHRIAAVAAAVVPERQASMAAAQPNLVASVGASADSMDGGATSPWMDEVGSRRERRPRAGSGTATATAAKGRAELAPQPITGTRPSVTGAAISEPVLAPAPTTADSLIPVVAQATVDSTSHAGLPESAAASPPVAISKAQPDYPEQAKKRRAEGWVEMDFVVTQLGTVANITVVRAEPKGLFDRAAMRALARWKFKPASRAGKPVDARVRTRIGFKLS